MSIADIKSGGWTLNERLTSAQMNSARAELIKCVDGVGGGTYTPSATVSISDLTVGSGNRLKYDSRSESRCPINYYAGGKNTADDWNLTASSAGTRSVWEQTATGTDYLTFHMKLPRGAVLDSVTCWFQGGGGHASVPASPLRFDIFYSLRTLAPSSLVAIGSTSTTSATTGAEYDALHTATLTSLAHSIGDSFDYWLRIRGETVATGGLFLACQATCTVTEQDEWVG